MRGSDYSTPTARAGRAAASPALLRAAAASVASKRSAGLAVTARSAGGARITTFARHWMVQAMRISWLRGRTIAIPSCASSMAALIRRAHALTWRSTSQQACRRLISPSTRRMQSRSPRLSVASCRRERVRLLAGWSSKASSPARSSRARSSWQSHGWGRGSSLLSCATRLMTRQRPRRLEMRHRPRHRPRHRRRPMRRRRRPMRHRRHRMRRRHPLRCLLTSATTAMLAIGTRIGTRRLGGATATARMIRCRLHRRAALLRRPSRLTTRGLNVLPPLRFWKPCSRSMPTIVNMPPRSDRRCSP